MSTIKGPDGFVIKIMKTGIYLLTVKRHMVIYGSFHIVDSGCTRNENKTPCVIITYFFTYNCRVS